MKRNDRATPGALPELGADIPGLMPAGRVMETPAVYTPEPDALLTAEQVGQRLGLTPQTVRKMGNDGRLQPVRLGHNIVRFRQVQIDAMIDMAQLGREAERAAREGEAETKHAEHLLDETWIRDAIEQLKAASQFAAEHGETQLAKLWDLTALKLAQVELS